MKSKSGAEAEQLWWRAIRVHSKAGALLQFLLSPLPLPGAGAAAGALRAGDGCVAAVKQAGGALPQQAAGK